MFCSDGTKERPHVVLNTFHQTASSKWERLRIGGVHFDWTSCHSSLISVALISADQFERRC